MYKIGYAGYYIKWFIFRPKTFGVQILLRNNNDLLLIQHTYMHRGLWDLPGGGIKEKENSFEAAKRETEEELKIDTIELKNIGSVEVYHSYHHDNIQVFEIKTDSREIDFNQVEIKKGQWFNISNLPTNLSKHTKKVLDLYLETIK